MVYRLKPHQWWTRYHQLGRKIERQGGRPTANDVRLAALLTGWAARSEAIPGGGGTPHTLSGGLCTAVDSMEWVLEYGKQAFEAQLRAGKAKALLDQDSRDHDPGHDRDSV